MNGLVALGAGIAALTGIGGGIGIGIATSPIEERPWHSVKLSLFARGSPR